MTEILRSMGTASSKLQLDNLDFQWCCNKWEKGEYLVAVCEILSVAKVSWQQIFIVSPDQKKNSLKMKWGGSRLWGGECSSHHAYSHYRVPNCRVLWVQLSWVQQDKSMKKNGLRTKAIQRLPLTKEVLESQITGVWESVWGRISLCCFCVDLLR